MKCISIGATFVEMHTKIVSEPISWASGVIETVSIFSFNFSNNSNDESSESAKEEDKVEVDDDGLLEVKINATNVSSIII